MTRSTRTQIKQMRKPFKEQVKGNRILLPNSKPQRRFQPEKWLLQPLKAEDEEDSND